MRERFARALLSRELLTSVLLLSWLLLALSVWGPWVEAKPAGLRILGLDLAEYVKFVAEVRNGQIQLVREVFYLPLVTLSLSLSLLVHRQELRLPGAVRWILNLLAVPAALAMLPPAWTPPLLKSPEFLKQTIAIGACLIAAVVSYPVLRRISKAVAAIVTLALSISAAALSISAFVRLQPALASIYGRPIPAGSGAWLAVFGTALLCCASLLFLLPKRSSAITAPSPPRDAGPKDDTNNL